MNNKRELLSGLDIAASDTIDEDLQSFYDERVVAVHDVFCGNAGYPHDLCSLEYHLGEIKATGAYLECRLLHFRDAMKFWAVQHVNTYLLKSPDVLERLMQKFHKVSKCLGGVLSRFGSSYSFSNGGYDVSGGASTMLHYCDDIVLALNDACKKDEEIGQSEERCLEQKRAYDERLERSDYFRGYMSAIESNVTIFSSLSELERTRDWYDDVMRSTQTWKIVDGNGPLAGGEGGVAKALRRSVPCDDYNKYYCAQKCERVTLDLIKKKRALSDKKKKSWLKDGYDDGVFRQWLKGVFDEVSVRRGDLTFPQYAFVFYRVCVDMGYAYEHNVLNMTSFIKHLSDSKHKINNNFNGIMACFKDSASLYERPGGDSVGSQSEAISKIFSGNKFMERLENELKNRLEEKKTAQA